MLSNLPPDFNQRAAEGVEHYHECASLCRYADHQLDPDFAIALFRGAAVCLGKWDPKMSVRRVIATKQLLDQALDLLECEAGHRSHDCDCDEIARSKDG